MEAISIAGGIGAVTGWIFAFRARGEAGKAKDAAAVAERDRAATELRAAQAERLQELAANSAAAGRVEIEALERGTKLLRATIEAERKAKGDLLARLQAKGIPVGDVAVDAVLDGLFPNSDSRETRPGTDRGSQDPGDDRSVPDRSSDPPSGTPREGR